MVYMHVVFPILIVTLKSAFGRFSCGVEDAVASEGTPAERTLEHVINAFLSHVPRAYV